MVRCKKANDRIRKEKEKKSCKAPRVTCQPMITVIKTRRRGWSGLLKVLLWRVSFLGFRLVTFSVDCHDFSAFFTLFLSCLFVLPLPPSPSSYFILFLISAVFCFSFCFSFFLCFVLLLLFFSPCLTFPIPFPCLFFLLVLG